MLQWNELRVTPDGKYLIIDVEVQNLDYYDNIYIQTLVFKMYSKSSDYSSDPQKGTTIYLWRDYTVTPGEGESYLEVGDEGTTYKHLRKIVDLELIGNNLFFVTATNNDDFAEDTPCGAQETSLLGIAYNKKLLYSDGIKALGTMNDCTPSTDLIEYILRMKMFTLSLEVGDYTAAIDYWNTDIKNIKTTTTTSKCGCYGN